MYAIRSYYAVHGIQGQRAQPELRTHVGQLVRKFQPEDASRQELLRAAHRSVVERAGAAHLGADVGASYNFV